MKNIVDGSGLTVASRASGLAQAQTRLACDFLAQNNLQVNNILFLTTEGDRRLDISLSKSGGKGLFIKEIEQALLDKKADIAVHSLKDMPIKNAPGLITAGFLEAASPHDCLVSPYDSIENLPEGSVIGTSSLRRAAQLKILRTDVKFALLRGNVLTRLARLDNKEYDGIVVAAAGLDRLNINRNHFSFSVETMTPAFNQGIIALQCRADDADLIKVLNKKNATKVSFRVDWERAIAQQFNASCDSAFGIYADVLSIDPLSVDLTVFACCSEDRWLRKAANFSHLTEALQWVSKEFDLPAIDWSKCQLKLF